MNCWIVVFTSFCLACTSAPVALETDVELAAPDWIAFDYSDSGHVLLAGAVNGHPANIVLDTGAEVSIIDQAFAEQIGLQSAGEVSVHGLAGTDQVYFARNLEFEIGNLRIRCPRVAVVDFSPFASISSRVPSALLGAEVFVETVVDIDYPNQRMAFRSAEDFQYDGPGETLATKALDQHRHALSASVEGHPLAWYLIDTGGDFTVSIYPKLADRQKLLKDRRPTSAWISMGIGGLIQETTASLERFSVGGLQLSDVPVSFLEDSDGRLAAADHDGIVGSAVLKRFRILFDLGHDRLHLEADRNALEREFTRNQVGLAALPQEASLRVLFVAPGSPAQDAGWREGMLLTQVDGQSGTGVELRARLRALSKAQRGRRVELVDGEGRVRPVVLTRFY